MVTVHLPASCVKGPAKGDVDTPFEEVLEKAKAGDPKAQTEVRISVHGETRAAVPSAWGPGQAGAECASGRGCSLPAPATCGPRLWCFHVCDVLLFFPPSSRERVCVHLCPAHS